MDLLVTKGSKKIVLLLIFLDPLYSIVNIFFRPFIINFYIILLSNEELVT
jgi:hypothetical protein